MSQLLIKYVTGLINHLLLLTASDRDQPLAISFIADEEWWMEQSEGGRTSQS